MTKHEFITQLTNELNRRKVADSADVVEEYEQHFAFKLADGYSEEEIAAKLGDPAVLAAQFGEADTARQKSWNKPLVVVGLCFADLFAGLFFVLLVAWGVVMAAASLSFSTLAICLLGGLNIYGLILVMPYWCGVILALSFIALAVLNAVGFIYYAAFLRQLVRSFGRFQHNALARASGTAALPVLAISPQFSAKVKRHLRSAALISLSLFAACIVLSYIVCSLSAGSLEFWHTWAWFMKRGDSHVRLECSCACVLLLYQCAGLPALQMPEREAEKNHCRSVCSISLF